MYAWFLVKSVGLWLLGVGLLVAGALALVYTVGLLFWQYLTSVQTGVGVSLPAQLLFADRALAQGPPLATVLPFIPSLEWAWLASPDAWPPAHHAVTWMLEQVHVGVPIAVIAVLMMLAGHRMARRRKAALAVVRMRRADRLRRRQEYRNAPVEPTLAAEPGVTPAVLRSRTREATG